MTLTKGFYMQNTEVTYGHWKAVILPNNLTIIADHKYLIGDIVFLMRANLFSGGGLFSFL